MKSLYLPNTLKTINIGINDKLYTSLNDGTLTFYQFKGLVMEKRENEKGSSEADLLDAFVAMGGDSDGGGCV